VNYILLTDPAGNSSIYDPAKNYQIIFSGTYQDTKLWLLEDEYERVNGRFQTADRPLSLLLPHRNQQL
jgi:hypothetical protein